MGAGLAGRPGFCGVTRIFVFGLGGDGGAGGLEAGGLGAVGRPGLVGGGADVGGVGETTGLVAPVVPGLAALGPVLRPARKP